MNLRKTLIPVAAICLAIAACTKDDSSESNTAILVAGKWQVSAATISVPGSPITLDVLDSIPACARDNFYTFATDGTATVDEGATKCDPSDPQTTTGNWKLLANDTKLEAVDPLSGEVTQFNIVTLNSTTLKVQDTATIDYLGAPVTVAGSITFKNVK